MAELVHAWQWRELTPEERFKRRYTVAENGCWIWNSKGNQDGYGRILIDGRQESAHRISYIWHIGDIPDGCEIDHICRNRLCVNPEHLEAVPHRVNVLRGDSAVPNIHCKRGHEMSGDNLGFNVKWQKRYCKACRKRSARIWNLANNYGR